MFRQCAQGELIREAEGGEGVDPSVDGVEGNHSRAAHRVCRGVLQPAGAFFTRIPESYEVRTTLKARTATSRHDLIHYLFLCMITSTPSDPGTVCGRIGAMTCIDNNTTNCARIAPTPAHTSLSRIRATSAYATRSNDRQPEPCPLQSQLTRSNIVTRPPLVRSNRIKGGLWSLET